jgi:DNA-binding SARP family transcriptional activator/predicted ATPase
MRQGGDAMPGLDIFLFGKPRVERDGAAVAVARRKALALLAYLAVTRQPHSRDALVALLWPELDSERGRAALRSTLASLHHAVGADGLVVTGDEVAFQDTPQARVDVARFHALLGQVAAHGHAPDHLCDDCLAALTEAADRYRGDFLAGFTLADAAEFDDWQTFQTESLRLELAGVLEKLAQGLAGRGQWDAAIGHTRRWLALDPLNEAAHCLLMRLHAGAGDRAAALRQYQECVKVLQEELGIEPEPETTALQGAIRSGAAEHPSPAPALSHAPAHNLPADPTPFIGREAELAQVAARLADPTCRLLTILGPGGIGKTRLAIQAARSEAERFAHGACFVDLAPIAAAEMLAPTILHTLQAPSYGAAEPDQHVLDYLAGKQMLIILDNYEQLLTGAEPDRRDGYGLVTKILDAAPRIKLLITSRARLNVRAEWLEMLEGMRTPGDELPERSILSEARPSLGRAQSKDAARLLHKAAPFDSALQTTQGSAQDARTRELETYSATALFLACAHRVRPDFQPTTDDARHIVHICRLLDGYPLAIELAAAWTRTLPLAKIARELEHGLDVLTTTMRDVPARHRSMVAAFDHSWRLLSPREQSLLRQLSVFNGSWTEQAAAAITGATLAESGTLADASWLRLAPTGRFEMHMLIKQYCARKLESEHEGITGENADRVHDRYAAYYRALLLTRQGGFYRHPDSVSEVAAELDHLLTTWRWFSERDELEAIRTLAPGLCWIAVAQGWGRAFRSQMEIYARKLKEMEITARDDPDRQRAITLVRAAVLAEILDELLGLSEQAWQAWVREAESLLAQVALEDERWRDERWREVHWTLQFRIAVGYSEQGNDDETIRRLNLLLPDLETGRLKLWPYCDEAAYFPLMRVCRCLGFAAMNRGDDREAQRLAEQSIARAEHINAPFFKLTGLMVLSSALNSLGEHRQAAVYARENLRILRSQGIRAYHSLSLMLMGTAAAGQGNTLQARACFRKALAAERAIGQLLMGALQNMGAVELTLGNLAQARRFYREALELCAAQGSTPNLTLSLTGLARIALARGDWAQARKHLLDALRTPEPTRRLRPTIAAVATWAELLQAEGQLEAAAELCSALLNWPATPIFAPQIMRPLRADLKTRLQDLAALLPPDVFAAATARGRSRQVDDVVAEIVGRTGTTGIA